MRAAIFIDGGYVLKTFQEAKINPDYSRMAEYLLAPLRKQIPIDLLRCYFYYCPPWMSQTPTEDELRRMSVHEKFVDDIESIDRWQIRLGKLEKRREGDRDVFNQKRVDVMLSVDMVRHAAAGHIQHAVLVAGDSDFIPAVNAAKDHGATITLVCARDRSAHKDLLKVADEVLYFDWKKFPVVKAAISAPQQQTQSVKQQPAQPQQPKAAAQSQQPLQPGETPKKKPTRRGGRRRKSSSAPVE
jgi:uncharacterized LabA/DUF88 family protein